MRLLPVRSLDQRSLLVLMGSFNRFPSQQPLQQTYDLRPAQASRFSMKDHRFGHSKKPSFL